MMSYIVYLIMKQDYEYSQSGLALISFVLAVVLDFTITFGILAPLSDS